MNKQAVVFERSSGLHEQAKRDATAVVAQARKPLMALAVTLCRIGEEYEAQHRAVKAEGGSWSDWCEKNAPVTKQQVDKYRRIFAAKAALRQLAKDGTMPIAVDDVVRMLPTSAEARQLAYASGGAGGANARDSAKWNTPEEYIIAARAVMGSIDFDPFSDAEANLIVKAKRYYDEDVDAFTTPWPVEMAKTVWMNPPYGRKKVGEAVAALRRHAPQLKQAIVLVNNATETQWFDALTENCAAVAFTKHRIQFNAADKARSRNTRGQAFVYFGENVAEFCRQFKPFCWVVSEVA